MARPPGARTLGPSIAGRKRIDLARSAFGSALRPRIAIEIWLTLDGETHLYSGTELPLRQLASQQVIYHSALKKLDQIRPKS